MVEINLWLYLITQFAAAVGYILLFIAYRKERKFNNYWRSYIEATQLVEKEIAKRIVQAQNEVRILDEDGNPAIDANGRIEYQ